jgi:hypothetical protein
MKGHDGTHRFAHRVSALDFASELRDRFQAADLAQARDPWGCFPDVGRRRVDWSEVEAGERSRAR